MISVCMIVKDEEKYIEKCLKALYKKFDEIVVVDTGSLDNTKKLVAKYTNKLFDYKWENNFSKARNFAAEKATNDWILVIDADEFLEKFDINKLITQLKKERTSVFTIKQINFFDDKKSTEKVNRLYNKRESKFIGLVHEQLVNINGSELIVKDTLLKVKHIGYTKEVVEKKDKTGRNIELLLKMIKENGNDPYIYYQLGKSYYMKKDYNKAVEYFHRAVAYTTNFSLKYTEDLIVSFAYAMLNTGRAKEAIMFEKYKGYYGISPDFNFVMGLISMNNAAFDIAISYFEQCTKCKEGTVEGVNSFLPNYNIGVIYECLGKLDMAKKYYYKCGDFKLAKDRIKISK